LYSDDNSGRECATVLEKIMKSIYVVLTVVVAAVLSGCITSQRCQMTVANWSDARIRSAVVMDTNGNSYAFANIDPQAQAAKKPVAAVLGKGIELRIVSESGTNVTRVLDLDPAVSPTWKGYLLIQIENDALVRTFFLPPEEGWGGDMPWAVPPAWQGVLNIPGMPGQQ